MTVPGPPVVAGIDDTPESLSAAAVAADLARRRLQPLRLVRALPADTETARTAAVGRLDAVRRAVGDVLPADAVTAVVREGPPGLVLLHESRSAALLVVGLTDAGGGLDETSAVLVRGTACPLLLARAHPDRSGVVVGVDGGPGTAVLLTTAVAEAALRSTSLLVLHAWDRTVCGPVEAAVGAAEQHLLDGYVRHLLEDSPSVPVDLRVLHAPTQEVLLQAARTAAVVVLGRQPHSRRGGTVEVVAGRAEGPVLVVPLPAPVTPPHPRRAVAFIPT